MTIGIVVYSLTGNTFAVAESIKQSLITGGHSVSFETIKAKNEDPNYTGSIELTQAPQLDGLKCIVLGGPVRGFATAPIMKAYLEQLPDLNGLPVYLFVTHHFPWAFLGGNSAIGMTRKLVEAKNGRVIGSGVVNWSSKHRMDNIQAIAKDVIRVVETSV